MNKKLFRYIIALFALLIIVSSIFVLTLTHKKASNDQPNIDDKLIIESIENENMQCSYDGFKHNVILKLPNNPTDAPFVLALCGYGDSPEQLCSMMDMDALLTENGYAVAYISGSRDDSDSSASTGWNSGLKQSDKDDVGFLVAFTKWMQKEYSLDTTRTFVIGFSNGAFMTHRLATDTENIFCGIISVAGMMPKLTWEQRPDTNNISVFQVYGTKDDVVPMEQTGTAKYSQAPSIESVMQYWADSNHASFNEEKELSPKSTLTTYKNDDNTNIWTLVITDGRHSWPSEQSSGLNLGSLILDFMSQCKY